ARAARAAALVVVGDDQGVAVEHRRLEARIRAHVLAYLLAHEPGVAVRGQTIEEDPERFPRPEVQRDRAHAQVADRREIADERVAGPQREGEPCPVLGGLDANFAQRKALAVELHARGALTFDLAFDPLKD